MKIGELAPVFSAEAAWNGRRTSISLEDYKGMFVVLFFYPKDLTPLCTRQNCMFRDQTSLFELEPPHRVFMLGISPDTVETHLQFSERYNLPFPLIYDQKHCIAEAYGAWGEETFGGRVYPSVLRKTYLISPEGKIINIYEVDVIRGHVEQVAQDLQREVSRS